MILTSITSDFINNKYLNTMEKVTLLNDRSLADPFLNERVFNRLFFSVFISYIRLVAHADPYDSPGISI